MYKLTKHASLVLNWSLMVNSLGLGLKISLDLGLRISSGLGLKINSVWGLGLVQVWDLRLVCGKVLMESYWSSLVKRDRT